MHAQGMNFLALLFLVTLDGDESGAFWLLCALIEDIRDADFYSDGLAAMNGFKADVDVSKKLVKQLFPDLASTIADFEGEASLDLLVDMLAPKAFISLFLDLLPLAPLFTLWDMIMDRNHGGSWAIIGFVAIIAASQDEILQAIGSNESMAYQAIIERARSLSGPFYSLKLFEIRAKVSLDQITRLRAESKRELAGGWTRQSSYERVETSFDVAEVEALLEKFREYDEGEGIDLPGFVTIINDSNINMSDGEAHAIFGRADEDDTGTLNFRELLAILSVLAKGSPSDKLSVLFDAHDSDGSGFLEEDEIGAIISSLTSDEAKAKELLEQKLWNLDKNADGKIARIEFLKYGSRDPELLLLLGCAEEPMEEQTSNQVPVPVPTATV